MFNVKPVACKSGCEQQRHGLKVYRMRQDPAHIRKGSGAVRLLMVET